VRPDDTIRIYPIRLKLWLALLGAILFVTLGVCILGFREELAPLRFYHGVTAVLAIVFFGACVVLILGRILVPSPTVVLSREGITDSTSPFGVGFLSWHDVAFVSIYLIEGQRMLGVFLKDAVSIMARLGGAKARYMETNLRMGFAPVNIPQLLVPMPLDELAELIQTRYGVEKRVSPR
jgi:hypothetical protein